ncbi:MAG: flavodoxin family protein [Candidatus Omnitrophica bacterium]|nr:flavodoxin family protein [Candidatus Omnitrophota bacterium]
MNVLGINGSPRIGGNTDVLLDKALEGARSSGAQTEKIVLNQLRFSPCQECQEIRDDGTCIIEDELQPLYRKIDEADIIILASPIFFGSLSAQAKMMIDRFQCAWRAKYILKKDIFQRQRKGGFISVEATTRKDFFANAKSIVKNFFLTINASYQEELFCSGIDEKGSILKSPDILNKAFELGKRIAAI